MSEQKTLGFVGLGSMGYHMAGHLAKAGYKMVVHDINENVLDDFIQLNENARKVNSPKEVADEAETVLVSLPTPPVVRTVAAGEDGLIHGDKIKVYIDLSTTGRDVAEIVGDLLLEQGIQTLDAPVSGGVIGAREKTLSIMVSGEADLFNTYEHELLQIGKKALYVGGRPGQAQVMKVINNLLSSTAIAATSEALVLGKKAGLDPGKMLDVLNVSSGRNSATMDKVEQYMLNRKFDYGFAIDLAYKDLKLCMDLAEKLQVPMFIGQNMTQLWRYSISQGYGKMDFTNILNVFEDWSNTIVEKEKK